MPATAPAVKETIVLSGHPTPLTLFVTHRPALVNYASRITGSRMQAEDLVQEAWLRFDEACKGRFLEDAAGYLYRIVRNLALDSRRQSRRDPQIQEAAVGEPDASPPVDTARNPETVTLYQDEFDRVMAAMAELPERTRIALEMSRFGGAKLREIATFLNISVPLAHKLVAEGIEYCKQRIGRT